MDLKFKNFKQRYARPSAIGMWIFLVDLAPYGTLLGRAAVEFYALALLSTLLVLSLRSTDPYFYLIYPLTPASQWTPGNILSPKSTKDEPFMSIPVHCFLSKFHLLSVNISCLLWIFAYFIVLPVVHVANAVTGYDDKKASQSQGNHCGS